MAQSNPIETEVKLRIPSTQALRPMLEALSFLPVEPMQEEESTLWDRGGELLAKGSALRLRRYGGKSLLTWKGPQQPDPELKIRPEIQTIIVDQEAMEGILSALGYAPAFRMAKRRATFKRESLEACLDETPFGSYLELEGDPQTIRLAMEHLGLDASHIEPRSYATLFQAYGSI
ncbi:MAG: class IV adenylate cyclase [Holophagaceae bacterium]|nr:class IV adenylate cyclase [Holophagaceae bacterium]